VIRAIPTSYNGTKFRSRLEADWAANLDSCPLPWEYEPEGYQLSDGAYYSPDFYLPSAKAWLEVKGAHMQRVSKVEQFAADLWAESGAERASEANAPMVLLGTEPLPDGNWNLHAIRPTGYQGTVALGAVGLYECPRDATAMLVAERQHSCRGCGYRFADIGMNLGQLVNGLRIPFRRLPRPAGRS
jgi:hypothetical protein